MVVEDGHCSVSISLGWSCCFFIHGTAAREDCNRPEGPDWAPWVDEITPGRLCTDSRPDCVKSRNGRSGSSTFDAPRGPRKPVDATASRWTLVLPWHAPFDAELQRRIHEGAAFATN